jgi:MOSC domain-containing protein YiiM
MKLKSLSIGLPENVEWRGGAVLTGIIKKPVNGPVLATKNGLQGDGVGDPEVHGGEHKAVYAFPHEHYSYFADLMNRSDFVPGQFGENLTTEGLLETEVQIGDRVQIGEAILEVTQPREPCFKLGIRMNDPGIVKPFLKSLRTGFYLRVIQEGNLSAGHEIVRVQRANNSISVKDITRVRYFDRADREVLEVAIGLEKLTPSWRDEFQEQLEKLGR